MSNEHKKARTIEWITTRHLWASGGYPCEYLEHAGKLFVASLAGDNEPAITEYDATDLADWYDRAEKSLLDDPECEDVEWPKYTGADFGDWSDAFGATGTEDA